MLRQAVTLTFDPLTLNVINVLVVTWSNCLPFFRKKTICGGFITI